MIDVFISHHTESSLEITKMIATKLEERGIRCWYAPRDTSGPYSRSISDAIDICKIFLLILNESASKSKHVLNELELAHDRPDDEISIIPFHIASEMKDISKDAKYYIKRLHWIDGITPNLDQGIDNLITRIEGELKTHYASSNSNDTPSDNNATVKSSLKSTFFTRNTNFIGRYKELELIHRELYDNRIVFVYGIGGTGKTQIAKKYIQLHKSDYDTIIMAHFETDLLDLIISDTPFSIDGFERHTNETDDDFGRRKLNKIKALTNEKTLIVIDNFDVEEDELLEEFLDAPYKVIFTTRMNFEHLGVPIVPIGAMNSEEQLKLFAQNYKRQLCDDDIININHILSLLSGHTLAIELVAKLMATQRIAPIKMIRKLTQSGISPDIIGTVKHRFDKANTLYGHIEAIFNLDNLSPNKIAVLLNLSLMPISGIDIDEFIELSELEYAEPINDLINRSWVQFDYTNSFVSLHPVISDIVRNKFSDDFCASDIFVHNLVKRFRLMWSMPNEQKALYGEFAKSLYKKMPQYFENDINIFRWTLYAFQVLDYIDLITEIVQKMLQRWDIASPLKYAWVLWNIADLYLQFQHFDKAIEYTQLAINSMSAFEKYPYDLAYMHKHLALIYHAKYQHLDCKIEFLDIAIKNLDESEKLFKIAIDKEETQFGSQCYNFGLDLTKEHDSQNGSRYSAYALNYYFRNDYDKALEYAQMSFDLFKRINGEIDADTTAPMRVLAMIYSKIGKIDEAIAMEKRVIYARGKLWGKNQFRYFEQFEVLADIYFENGKKDEAINELQQLLELIQENDMYSEYVKKINKKISQYKNSTN